MSNSCSKIKPWSVRFYLYIFHRSSVFRQKGNNGHRTLVSLTEVKNTSAETILSLFEQCWKKWFLALVGLAHVKGTNMRNKSRYK